VITSLDRSVFCRRVFADLVGVSDDNVRDYGLELLKFAAEHKLTNLVRCHFFPWQACCCLQFPCLVNK
jgi:hypothetical protein